MTGKQKAIRLNSLNDEVWLTGRQAQVLKMYVKADLSIPEIAERLELSEMYISNVLKAIGKKSIKLKRVIKAKNKTSPLRRFKVSKFLKEIEIS